MGWGSGSYLMSEVIGTIKSHVPDFQKRKGIYAELIESFESHDCDTLCDCLNEDSAFNDAFNEIHP